MFVFLDTKTTGTDKDDRLCQIAFKTEAGLIVNELFNPGKPIPIEAMSVNHITNEMVKDKPQFKNSDAWRSLTELFADTDNIMVAHNAMFDVAMLRKEDVHPQKTICTYKIARFLDKDGQISQYNLQYLRYYLKLNVDAKPHSQIREWGFSFGGVSIRYLIFRNLCARDKLYEI
jgi:DNA polymerase III epsilon subunit-like protein